MLFGLGGQLDVEILESERLIDLKGQLDDPDDFGFYLAGRAEDVGIVLGELPDAEKPVHDAAGFVPMHEAKLGNPHGELAVRVLPGLIDQAAAGTIHRLYRVVGVVEPGEVHVFFVVVPVAAPVPQLLVENDGRANLLVPISIVNAPPEVHDGVPDNHPFGMNERKAGTGLVETKQVQLPAEDAVVPFFRFSQPVQVIVKLFAGRPGRAVNALEHFLRRVAVPIRAGHRHHFCTPGFSGTGHMRPPA